jgi:hypothetical protein
LTLTGCARPRGNRLGEQHAVGPRRDVVAGARHRAKQAPSLEKTVGLQDRASADAAGGANLPDGGQAIAGSQHPRKDLLFKITGERLETLGGQRGRYLDGVHEVWDALLGARIVD